MMSRRHASLAAFLAALPVSAAGLWLRVSALTGALVPHNGEPLDRRWLIGRGFVVVAIGLLAASLWLAVAAPPDPRRRRMWWVVPATALAIVIAYFDFFVLGLG